MKKYLKIAVPILLFVGALMAANWSYTKVAWNDGDITSATLVESEADTSDVFDLTRKGKGGRNYPDEVSFLMRAVEGENSDSTDITFTMELSNDQVVWYAWGTLQNISDTDGNGETNTASKTLVMSSSYNPLASIATTEAFTMTYDSTLNEDILAQPFVGGSNDSSAYVTSVANTRADTYTYNFGLLPQYQFARIIATGQGMVGDTITVAVDMSRVWK